MGKAVPVFLSRAPSLPLQRGRSPGLFFNLTLFSLLRIKYSIRVQEERTSSLNSLAWAVVGLESLTMTNRQCRVELVGKWPLDWPRGAGSVTFGWQIIAERKIWAKVFSAGHFQTRSTRKWYPSRRLIPDLARFRATYQPFPGLGLGFE